MRELRFAGSRGQAGESDTDFGIRAGQVIGTAAAVIDSRYLGATSGAT